MIWIIIAIIIVGFFIIRAINKNTNNNAIIAQQQYLNSPEYINQKEASLEYLSYIEEEQSLNSMVIGAKIGKAMDLAEHPLDKNSVKDGDDRIKHFENKLKSLTEAYLDSMKKYPNYHPLSIELSYKTFDNYFNEDGSSYDNYLRRSRELNELEARLSEVSKENYDPYKEALSIVKSEDKASPSLLQRRMTIGYARAKKYIDKMEKDGIITKEDGARPRKILHQI